VNILISSGVVRLAIAVSAASLAARIASRAAKTSFTVVVLFKVSRSFARSTFQSSFAIRSPASILT
jgi:hypothetical protein